MKFDYISMLLEAKDRSAILDSMAQTSFTALLEIDLNQDTWCNLYQIEGRFFAPQENKAYSHLFTFAREHMVHPEDIAQHNLLMDPATMWERLETARTPGILLGSIRYKLVDGSWCPTELVLIGGTQYGLPEGVVYLYLYDVEEQRPLTGAAASPAEDPLRDELTGLLREKAFIAMAREKMADLQGEWCMIAIDIEHFKLFRDWNGQDTGNRLLMDFGVILSRAVEECGGLAGYRGQDDFCVLMPYDMDRIKRLHGELREAIRRLSSTVGFGPIFGVCKIENPTESVMDIINHAALTAEEIKGDFRVRIQLYNAELHEKNSKEFRLLSDFQHALENGEILFYLQPQCRVSSGRVVGAESLARWCKPDGSWVSPGIFVPVLEKYGIVTNLDQYIWEQVCVWLRRVIDKGVKPVPVSINISQIDFFTIDVPAFLTSLIQKYDIPAGLLKVEVTESAYVEDTAVVRGIVKKLREAGFLVLMDDFGSGYSSLNMLRNLNVDVIKLDAQFLYINDKETRRGVSIVESIINMTKMLGTPVIAEGVESKGQANFLADLGCRYMQGYYFYRPMPPDAFEKLIADGSHADHSGFIFKANLELHSREFLNESLYSDAMLNNVLGPVCFYSWKGDNIDIIRYNQQYYQMVGLEADVLEERRFHIQDYFYPDDLPVFYRILETARQDRINGCQGDVRVYKPNNTVMWLRVHVYYLDEDDNGIKFYGSCHDITELKYISYDMPGAYYRCNTTDGYEFRYISENFLNLTGYTEDEIKEIFNNRLISMVHPDDAPYLIGDADAMLDGEQDKTRPYRLRHKDGRYVYVVEKDQLTEQFGELNFQCIAIEVDDIMKMRNQMSMLTKFFTGAIAFVHGTSVKDLRYEVAVYGLEKQLGMDAAAFERSLNDGSFLAQLDTPAERRDRNRYWQFIEHPSDMNDICTFQRPGQPPIHLHCKFDGVKKPGDDTVCVIVFTYLETKLLTERL